MFAGCLLVGFLCAIVIAHAASHAPARLSVRHLLAIAGWHACVHAFLGGVDRAGLTGPVRPSQPR